jgi:hypothetical protein
MPTNAKKKPPTKLSPGKLKSFVDAGKSSSRVLGPVERFVLSTPVDNSRSFSGLHPSAIVSQWWCHRASYFHLRGHHPAPQQRTLARELIFAQGHAIHDTWQTWFAQMGKLYGTWECRVCGNYFWDLSPKECSECESSSFKYKEVPVENDELLILGHADGWLKGFGNDLMLEIKSVGQGTFMWLDKAKYLANGQDFDKSWKELGTPFESHISQVQLYMEMAKLADPTAPDEALILYEAKPTQAVKEFYIPRDKWGIQHILDGAALVKDAIMKQVAPDCNIGGAHKCKQCKEYNE